jgi:hypothetical protein
LNRIVPKSAGHRPHQQLTPRRRIQSGGHGVRGGQRVEGHCPAVGTSVSQLTRAGRTCWAWRVTAGQTRCPAVFMAEPGQGAQTGFSLRGGCGVFGGRLCPVNWRRLGSGAVAVLAGVAALIAAAGSVPPPARLRAPAPGWPASWFPATCSGPAAAWSTRPTWMAATSRPLSAARTARPGWRSMPATSTGPTTPPAPSTGPTRRATAEPATGHRFYRRRRRRWGTGWALTQAPLRVVLASATGDCCPHATLRHARPHRHRTRPKGQRSVAVSLDWPGWSRGAKSAELALETLESYRERYRPVAALAGMAGEFDAAGPLRSWRTRSEPVRPTSGASPSRPRRPSRADGRGRTRTRDHAPAGLLGVL